MAFFDNILRGTVSHIRIETAYGPTLDIPDPFGDQAASGGVTSMGAKLMKPTITLNPGTAQEYVLAPYGVSHGEGWPLVQALVLAAGLVVGGVVIRKLM